MEPTIAGAARPRNDAPEVAANRSRISFARVGCVDRLAAPLSWTISSASVQPIGRRRATSSMVRPQDTAIVPVGRSFAEQVHGDLGHGVAREVVGLLAGRGGGNVGDHGRGQPEPGHQRVLEIHEAGGGVDDLDADDGLLDRTVQEPAHLEAAQAQPVTDLGLAEVHAVVQLCDPHHQADIARASTPDCEHRSSA